MKIKTVLSVILASLFVFSALAARAEQEIMPCDQSGKSLYRDIQIYYESKSVLEEALVRPTLEKELKIKIPAFQNASEQEKVHMLATGFAKCDMHLTASEIEQDKEIVILAKEAELKRKNPFVTDESQ